MRCTQKHHDWSDDSQKALGFPPISRFVCKVLYVWDQERENREKEDEGCEYYWETWLRDYEISSMLRVFNHIQEVWEALEILEESGYIEKSTEGFHRWRPTTQGLQWMAAAETD